jgi:hypothetical protein
MLKYEERNIDLQKKKKAKKKRNKNTIKINNIL